MILGSHEKWRGKNPSAGKGIGPGAGKGRGGGAGKGLTKKQWMELRRRKDEEDQSDQDIDIWVNCLLYY